MNLSRRTLIRAVPVASLLGAVGLAACSGSIPGGSTSTATASGTESLTLSESAWTYDADNDVYYQMGVRYVASPQDVDYESLSIMVPGAYVDGSDNGDGTHTLTPAADGARGRYTVSTAPVVLPVNTPGYSAQQPLSEYSYDSVAPYMEAGIIYVHAGIRGKDSTTDSAAGNAPWGVTDLKAAVRFMRLNAALVPGDMEQMYVFGHSGGGAQSAVMGASGDSPLYTPYLEALGAAMTDARGAEISDAVAGAMCWCPITSLDSANAAYEWNMGQFASDGTRAPGQWTEAYSKDLAAAYAGHVNALGLVDSAGSPLTLEESSQGVCLAGSYYEHVVSIIEGSLNEFLATTDFPYTPDTTQMAGMSPGSDSALSETPPSGDEPGGGAPSGDSQSTTESTTYETVEDYIAALNAEAQWVTYDSQTRTATITGLADVVSSQKPPTKDVGALDGVDRGQTENTVLGVGTTTAHFSQLSRDVIAAGEDRYASLTGWSQDNGSEAYDNDFAMTDSVGTDVLTRERMYNPMFFLSPAYDGAGTSSVAPHWRIRTGLTQGDTASTVEINLALALEAAGSDVDFATVWGQGHTMAETSGSAEENFISWLDETINA